MQNEYDILTHLSRDGHTSQRRIAARVGLSVGTVNLLLQKMVRKGLVKLERVNGRTLRYIITPKGMAEKTRLAYQYLRNSYQQIIKINDALRELAARHAAAHGACPRVIFLGPTDEILEMLKTAAGSLNLEYAVVATSDELVAATQARCPVPEDCLVITWNPETVVGLPDDVPHVNILDRLDDL